MWLSSHGVVWFLKPLDVRSSSTPTDLFFHDGFAQQVGCEVFSIQHIYEAASSLVWSSKRDCHQPSNNESVVNCTRGLNTPNILRFFNVAIHHTLDIICLLSWETNRGKGAERIYPTNQASGWCTRMFSICNALHKDVLSMHRKLHRSITIRKKCIFDATMTTDVDIAAPLCTPL